jgi:hypothetical protein
MLKLPGWHYFDDENSINSPNHGQHDFFVLVARFPIVANSSRAMLHFIEYKYSNTNQAPSPVTKIRNESSSLASEIGSSRPKFQVGEDVDPESTRMAPGANGNFHSK